MTEAVVKPTPPVVSGARPVIGHFAEFRSNRTKLLQRGLEEHGKAFTLKLGPQEVAVLVGPEYQRIFFTETDKALDMAEAYTFLKPIFGEVLFIAGHENYLRMRPLITQAFRREKMMRYIDVMIIEVQRWLDGLGDDGEMDVVDEMIHLAQEIAGHAILGEEFQEQVGKEFWGNYQHLARAIDVVLPPDWPLPKFRRRDKARAEMMEILKPILAERRAHPERYDDFLQDFVDGHYADGEPVEDEVLLNLILGLMFAGHETTAGQAAWNIILLLQNPDYLDQVQAEIERVIPEEGDLDGRKLLQLDLLGYAVTETERMRPSADMIMRSVTSDIEVGPYVIPAGWRVQLSADLGHNLPDLFAEPEQYDPLRYAPGREEDKQERFSLIGFGGGMHKCTGMNFANYEMTVIAALLFQQFDLELITKNPTVQHGMGASRPTPTRVRYHRKDARPETLAEGEAAEVA